MAAGAVMFLVVCAVVHVAESGNVFRFQSNDGGINQCPPEQIHDWTIEYKVKHVNCNMYYQCVHARPVLRHCPPGLHFAPNLQRCDWPQIANCEDITETTTTTTTTPIPTTISTAADTTTIAPTTVTTMTPAPTTIPTSTDTSTPAPTTITTTTPIPTTIPTTMNTTTPAPTTVTTIAPVPTTIPTKTYNTTSAPTTTTSITPEFTTVPSTTTTTTPSTTTPIRPIHPHGKSRITSIETEVAVAVKMKK